MSELLHSVLNTYLKKHKHGKMIQINIALQRDKRIAIGLDRLRHKIPAEAMPEILDKISKEMQKSAKLRAPRWTGELAKSIIIQPGGRMTGDEQNILVSVASPYGAYQEFGFTPHRIGPYTPTKSFGGLIFAEWLFSHGMRGRLARGYTVRKFKPFVKPAIQTVRGKMPKIIRPIIRKAILSSR